jgi:hypothetical protein
MKELLQDVRGFFYFLVALVGLLLMKLFFAYNSPFFYAGITLVIIAGLALHKLNKSIPQPEKIEAEKAA